MERLAASEANENSAGGNGTARAYAAYFTAPLAFSHHLFIFNFILCEVRTGPVAVNKW